MTYFAHKTSIYPENSLTAPFKLCETKLWLSARKYCVCVCALCKFSECENSKLVAFNYILPALSAVTVTLKHQCYWNWIAFDSDWQALQVNKYWTLLLMTQTWQFSAYQDYYDDRARNAVSPARYVVWQHLDLASSATAVQETPPEMHWTSKQSCTLWIPKLQQEALISLNCHCYHCYMPQKHKFL